MLAGKKGSRSWELDEKRGLAGRWEPLCLSQHHKKFDHRQTRIIYECFFMCYFMHFDPISSRIQGDFQPYVWSRLGGVFRGHFLLEKRLLKHTSVLYSLLFFADSSQSSLTHLMWEPKTEKDQ